LPATLPPAVSKEGPETMNRSRPNYYLAKGYLLCCVWLCAVLAAPVALHAQQGDDPQAPSAVQKQREGAVLEMTGIFKATGDRVAFYPADGKDSYLALENLALNRISISLTETRTPRVWSIKGMITEYRGSNFLLVQRAVMLPLAAKPRPPATPPSG